MQMEELWQLRVVGGGLFQCMVLYLRVYSQLDLGGFSINKREDIELERKWVLGFWGNMGGQEGGYN